jgi:glutaredoxin
MAQAVMVYSNMGCIPCHPAMEYLSQKGVPFIEKNVAREPGAMQDLMRLGLHVLPVIVIGAKHLSGFNPTEVDAALVDAHNQAEAASL